MTVESNARGPQRHPPGGRAPFGLPALFAAFAAFTAPIFLPALQGPFISDDFLYIAQNPYIARLSAENLLAILNPWGPAAAQTANYAPVHLLLHALEIQLFGNALLGYHLVNVLAHALATSLLVLLLRSVRVSEPAALLGGLLFAVHPANVEAVAWISQLKTTAALAFALGALLLRSRRPAIATLLFALGLLTKASAAFALPMAAAFEWSHSAADSRARPWAWLAVWIGLLGLYAVPAMAAFDYGAGREVLEFEEIGLRVRTIAAIGMRYLTMAATSRGVSAFQEVAPAVSLLDPWWLTSVPVGALLAWRTVSTLRRRKVEAAFWIGAASSFAIVSQVFPFVFPMADRYLYCILPGLIGGATLWGLAGQRNLAAWLAARGQSPASVKWLGRGAAIAALLLAAFFAVQSGQRAALWRAESNLLADAAQHYPDGATAHYLRAVAALERGDRRVALNSLREALARGIDEHRQLLWDPHLVPLHDEPEYRELVYEMAGRLIEYIRGRSYTAQAWLHTLAIAHDLRGEHAAAAEAYERAIRAEGSVDRSVLISGYMRSRELARQAAREQGETISTPQP